MSSRKDITLVLGGARSGKSRYAESLFTAWPPPWTYVATAQALDDEMRERIAAHQRRRGGRWITLEAPREVPEVLARQASTPVLVDCLTLWLSNVLLAGTEVEAKIQRLDEALGRVVRPVVLVTNEVGSGIVPDNALARRFRDLQGLLNQRMAARAERVVLVVAGLPLTIKGPS